MQDQEITRGKHKVQLKQSPKSYKEKKKKKKLKGYFFFPHYVSKGRRSSSNMGTLDTLLGGIKSSSSPPPHGADEVSSPLLDSSAASSVTQLESESEDGQRPSSLRWPKKSMNPRGRFSSCSSTSILIALFFIKIRHSTQSLIGTTKTLCNNVPIAKLSTNILQNLNLFLLRNIDPYVG